MPRPRAASPLFIAVARASLSATPALADQCAWNRKDVADKGRELIAKATTMLDLCEPCGDRKPKPVEVKTATVESRDQGYFAVLVNGAEVDLA